MQAGENANFAASTTQHNTYVSQRAGEELFVTRRVTWNINGKNARQKSNFPMQSSMQKMAAENARLRRTGQIDGICCWLAINIVVWGVVWEIVKGVM